MILFLFILRLKAGISEQISNINFNQSSIMVMKTEYQALLANELLEDFLTLEASCEDTLFENNTVINGNGGSAVKEITDSPTVEIINCSFRSNYAELSGGSLYFSINQFISITDTEFYGNLCGEYGGAIYITCGNQSEATRSQYFSIVGNEFQRNQAGIYGNALYFSDSCQEQNYIIDQNTFIDNFNENAKYDYVIASKPNPLNISTNTFRNSDENRRLKKILYIDELYADYDGVNFSNLSHALVIREDSPIEYIRNCKFTNCCTEERYVIILHRTIEFENNVIEFDPNFCQSTCGLLVDIRTNYEKVEEFVVFNSKFIECSGDSEGITGIVIQNNNDLFRISVLSCEFNNCYCSDGYIIKSGSNSVTIENSTLYFSDNKHACSGIDASDKFISIVNNQFVNLSKFAIKSELNESSETSFEFILRNNTITNFRFSDSPNAESILKINADANVTISGCTIDLMNDNELVNRVIDIFARKVVFEYNTIQNVKKVVYPSRICTDYNELTVDHCNFINITTINDAVENSGGCGLVIYQDNNYYDDFGITFTDCLWENCKNNKKIGGGAILFSRDLSANTGLKFIKCNFTTNQADKNGGAIAIQTVKELLISECNFLNNEAINQFGGAIYIDTSVDPNAQSEMISCEITGCTFEGNHARENHGHVICVEGETNTPFIFKSSNILINNNNDNGGGSAIIYKGKNLDLSFPTFADTKESRFITFCGTAQGTISNIEFKGCQEKEGNGNAVLVDEDVDELNFNNCKFTDCGTRGYMMKFLGTSTQMENCHFTFTNSSEACCGLDVLGEDYCLFKSCLFARNNKHQGSLVENGAFSYRPVNQFEGPFIMYCTFDDCVGDAYKAFSIQTNIAPFFSYCTISNMGTIDDPSDYIAEIILSGGDDFTIGNLILKNNFCHSSYGGGSGLIIKRTDGNLALQFDTCTCEDNHAIYTENIGSRYNGVGGAFQTGLDDCFSNIQFNFISCTFIRNKSDREGGALAIQAFQNVVINDCHFEFNEAGIESVGLNNNAGCGGALYIDTEFHNPTSETNTMNSISIEKCTFTNNNAVNGHAIFIRKATYLSIYISDQSSFSDNGNHSCTILTECQKFNIDSDTSFTFTEKDVSSRPYDFAPGLAAVYQSMVFENIASSKNISEGNVIYLAREHTSATITNCTFINCGLSGFTISCYTADLKFSNNTIKFDDSQESSRGLGLLGQGNFELSDSSFSMCNSKDDGGAIFMETLFPDKLGSDSIEINSCEFENNFANRNGGAIYFAGIRKENNSRINIYSSLFIQNRCIKRGGAIYIDYEGEECSNLVSVPYLQINNTIFIKNQAGEYGNAIFNNDNCFENSISIGTNTFTDNFNDTFKHDYVIVSTRDPIDIEQSVFNNTENGKKAYPIYYLKEGNNSYENQVIKDLKHAIIVDDESGIDYIKNCSFIDCCTEEGVVIIIRKIIEFENVIIKFESEGCGSAGILIDIESVTGTINKVTDQMTFKNVTLIDCITYSTSITDGYAIKSNSRMALDFNEVSITYNKLERSSGTIKFNQSGCITLNNCFFNSVKIDTGTLLYKPINPGQEGDYITFSECLFDGIYGCCFYAETISESKEAINVFDCKFSNVIGFQASDALEGTGIKILENSPSISISIERNVFHNCGTKESYYVCYITQPYESSFRESKVILFQDNLIKFDEIDSGCIGLKIHLSHGHAFVYNCTFEKCCLSQFRYPWSNSIQLSLIKADVSFCQFDHCITSSSGSTISDYTLEVIGISDDFEAEVVIQNCTFDSISAGISTYVESTTVMNNCFINCTLNVFRITSSKGQRGFEFIDNNISHCPLGSIIHSDELITTFPYIPNGALKHQPTIRGNIFEEFCTPSENENSFIFLINDEIPIIFENNTFIDYNNNDGGFGGKIDVYQSTTTSTTLVFQDCYFIINTESSISGSAFRCTEKYNHGLINLSFVGCHFEHFSTDKKGGAISLENYLTAEITRCTFKENTAQTGHAIFFDRTKEATAIIKIDNCNFTDNGDFKSNNWQGYTIYSTVQHFEFTNSKVEFADATKATSAIYLGGTGESEISKIYFRHCNSNEQPNFQSMAIEISSDIQSASVVYCTFDRCGYYPEKAAIFDNGKNTVIDNCQFLNEKESTSDFVLQTGSVTVNSYGIHIIQNCFTQHSNANNGTYQYTLQPSNDMNLNRELTLTNITIDEAHGTNANAINLYLTNKDKVSDITIKNCKQGNRFIVFDLDTQISNFEMNNFNFLNNEIKDLVGGALFNIYGIDSLSIRVCNCSFELNANSQYGSGGAMILEKYNFEINSCTFANNSADANGGALFISELKTVIIHSCQFINNLAKTGNGGAIFVESKSDDKLHIDSISIIDSTFESNSGSDGFAIFIKESEISQQHINISGNNFINNYNLGTIIGSSIITIEPCFIPSENILEENTFSNELNDAILKVKEYSCTEELQPSSDSIDSSDKHSSENEIADSTEESLNNPSSLNSDDLTSFLSTETSETESNETNTQDIESNETNTQDIESNETNTQDIESNETNTQDIESNETNTQDIESNETNTQDIESNETNTQDIESNETNTQDIESNETNTQDIESNETNTQDIESSDINTQDTFAITSFSFQPTTEFVDPVFTSSSSSSLSVTLSFSITFSRMKSVTFSFSVLVSSSYTLVYDESIGSYIYSVTESDYYFNLPYVITYYTQSYVVTMLTKALVKEKGISPEQLIGIVCGSVAALFLAFFIALSIYRHKRKIKFVSDDFMESSDVIYTKKNDLNTDNDKDIQVKNDNEDDDDIDINFWL